ncbi:MAG TPA: hypothetical protein DCE41_07635 [Cytophagales bacterium]|nr:hypothetical protein [Cytophagales bacterium]HAA24278.1 hypothetical protein [Cytophagales bacterium]HAP64331.1 hypothetical protein [Cytophagales bacterium]
MPVSLEIAATSTTIAPQDVLYLEIEHQVNRIPWANVEIWDHQGEENKFQYLDDPNLAPGKEVTITVKVDTSQMLSFQAIIVGTQFREGPKGQVLSLQLRDPAYRLTRGKKYRVFPKDTTDEAAFKEVITELPGSPLPVSAGTLDAVGVKHSHLVQFDVTNWDFLCTRADACGRVVTIENGAVSVVEPKLASPTPLSYQTGDVLSYELAADAIDLVDSYSHVANDLSKGDTTKVTSNGSASALASDWLTSSDAATALGASPVEEFMTTPLTKAELDVYAQGKVTRSNLTATRGYVQVNLTQVWSLAPGQALTLEDFPGSYNGTAFVAGTKFQFDHTGNTLHIQLGMSGASYLEEREYRTYPAHGVIPPVHGLQYAEVKKIEADPNKTLKLLVELMGESPSKGKFWAYLATPYAGVSHTMWFQPEIGDLVVIGFVNNDPRYPVVLGSLHRKEADNPVAWDAKNINKGIMVQNNVGILFQDKDGLVTITNAEQGAGQTVILDKKTGAITLSHKDTTTVVLSDNGVEVTTDKDFILKAANVKVEGDAIELTGGKIDMKN